MTYFKVIFFSSRGLSDLAEDDNSVTISITTAHAHIHLKTPSKAYENTYQVLDNKAKATKMVYTILHQKLNEGSLMDFKYDDLIEECTLNAETKFGLSDFSETSLLSYGPFIFDHILETEEQADEDENTVILSPALRQLGIESNAESKKLEKEKKQRSQRKKRLQKRQNR